MTEVGYINKKQSFVFGKNTNNPPPTDEQSLERSFTFKAAESVRKTLGLWDGRKAVRLTGTSKKPYRVTE